MPDGDEREAMAAELLERLEVFCTGFPRPFVDEVDSDAVYSSDDDDFEAASGDAPVATAQRRLPSRRARAKVVNMGEVDSEDEENADGGRGARDDGESGGDEDKDGESGGDEDEDAYAADAENSAVNSPLPTPKPKGARDKRRQSLASVAALGEALSNQRLSP